jgi:hypothetical protein
MHENFPSTGFCGAGHTYALGTRKIQSDDHTGRKNEARSRKKVKGDSVTAEDI